MDSSNTDLSSMDSSNTDSSSQDSSSNSSSKDNARIPIAVLTGFLGSGKTTLLKHLGQVGELTRTLVLVNEFGEVGLDHHLLTPIADDTLVAISSGCICCTIRADLAETLAKAPGRYARGGERWFDRVVIETTGIADPAPILQTILGDFAVSIRYSLASVVTTVDALNGLESLRAHPEALKQVAVADRIALTKTDLVTADQQQPLLGQLNSLAPSAPVIPVVAGAADIDWFFDGRNYVLDGKHPDVETWLGAERQFDAQASGHGQHGHSEISHDHDKHDHNRHDHNQHDLNRHARIKASCLRFADPVDPALFEACLQSLLQFRGADMLRIKGIINVVGMDKPMVIHGVQHVFHRPEILDAWPSADRDTRIVLIARDLDHEELRGCFAALGLDARASAV